MPDWWPCTTTPTPGSTASRSSCHSACGVVPLQGLLVAAGRHRLDVELLDVRTSADTAGDPERVVGYGAFALAVAGSR